MMRLTRIPVDSSMLNAVAYDAKSETLVVEFNNGKVWAYFKVSAEIFDDLIVTHNYGGSIGRFMHAHVLGMYEEGSLSRNLDFVW